MLSHIILEILTAHRYVHDNDTSHILPVLLDTGIKALLYFPETSRDMLLYAEFLTLRALNFLCTSEFVRAEESMAEGLNIYLDLIPADSGEITGSYSILGMACGSQGRYEDGAVWFQKAEQGSAEVAQKIHENHNAARNCYCMGLYDQADRKLQAAMTGSVELDNWYFIAQ